MAGPITASIFTILFLGLCSLRGTDASHDIQLDSEEVHRLMHVIENIMECRDIPGLSMAVVKEGSMVLNQGFGKADRENDIDVDENTLFSIGSLTKAFTATLLAMLMEDHRNITWSTRVKDILPDFEMPTKYMTDHVTIDDVIAHRTGLPRNDLIWVAKEFSRDELYRRLRYFKPKEPFRNTIVYTNTAYSILGKVIEKLSGRTFEQAIEERIFRPLGMSSSTFYDTGVPTWENYAKPYSKDGPSDPLWAVDQFAVSGCDVVGPATSISSTARDMSRWLEFLTRGGQINETYRLMGVHANEEIYKPITAIRTRPNDGSAELPDAPVTRSMDTYSRGWLNGFYRGYRIYTHTGSMFGYETLITVIPDISAAIYTGLNGPMGMAAVVANLVLHNYMSDMLLNKTPWLDEQTVCTYPKPWKEHQHNVSFLPHEHLVNKTIPPSRPLLEYVGRYGNLAFGNVSVAVNTRDRQLIMRYGRQGRFLLYPMEVSDAFTVEATNHLSFLGDLSSKYTRRAFIEFSADESNNNIEKIRVSMFNFLDPPVFVKGLQLPLNHDEEVVNIEQISVVQSGCACGLSSADHGESDCGDGASSQVVSLVVIISGLCLSFYGI